MNARSTPAGWRQGFSLYRHRTGSDALGSERAYYDMDTPDLVRSAAQGMDLQPQKGWNSAGRISSGAEVTCAGEFPGGLLEAYWREEAEIAPFDRLALDGQLWEVRSVHRWPHHKMLMLQRLN
jgi:hypothetical protein